VAGVARGFFVRNRFWVQLLSKLSISRFIKRSDHNGNNCFIRQQALLLLSGFVGMHCCDAYLSLLQVLIRRLKHVKGFALLLSTTMNNLLIPLDYIYSWTESVVFTDYERIKIKRTIAIMSFAIVLVLFPSCLLIANSTLGGGTLSFEFFLMLMLILMPTTYLILYRIYYTSRRSNAFGESIMSQIKSNKQVLFLVYYTSSLIYFGIILSFISHK
jgi:hypothetical protein